MAPAVRTSVAVGFKSAECYGPKNGRVIWDRLGSYWDILGRYIISPTIARIIPNHRMEIKVSLEAGSKHILEATLIISDD